MDRENVGVGLGSVLLEAVADRVEPCHLLRR